MKDVMVSLFDKTGKMAEPWLEAGYECWIVDTQHPPAYDTGGVTSEGRLHRVHADLRRPWLPPFERSRCAFFSAFTPCDHMAVSGARWFKGKGLRALALSIELFATSAEMAEWFEAPYIIENPVSTLATYWRKADHTFSPEHFTGWAREDNYTKTTCLWVGGGFVMPPAFQLEGLPKADDRIHKCAPGPERKNIRSATPMGFARAAFEYNRPRVACAANAQGERRTE